MPDYTSGNTGAAIDAAVDGFEALTGAGYTGAIKTTGAATFGGEVAASQNVELQLSKSFYAYTTSYGIGTPDSDGLQIFYGASDSLRFGTRASEVFTERMRLDASGNLLVGTTSFGSNVGVQARGSAGGAADEPLATSVGGTGSINQVGFYNPNGRVGSVSTSGSSTAYNTSSDPRLKSEFVEPVGALAKIIEARETGIIGVFNFLSDPETPVLGYNAHKLIDMQSGFGGTEGQGPRGLALGEEYEPAVLDEDGNVITPAKKVSPAGVDQSKRVPLLEAAIYELLKRIEALEAV